MRRNQYDQEGIRMIIAQRNFGEKQRLDKDYFRRVTRASLKEYLEVFPSITNIVIIQDAAHFSLSHAPDQSVFKMACNHKMHDFSSNINGTRMDHATAKWFVAKRISRFYLTLIWSVHTYPFRHPGINDTEFYLFNII